VAGVNHNDTDDLALALVNRPLDVLFLLNQLAVLPDDNPLKNLFDHAFCKLDLPEIPLVSLMELDFSLFLHCNGERGLGR
jgi:hypothetical protein